MTNPIILMIGTRPEGIKMLPVYFACKRLQIPIVLVSTHQHSELLDEVYTLFGVKPDYQLNIMKPNQDLFHITCSVLEKVKELFNKINPRMVLVQGDTTSSMAATLAAFYLQIPVGHIEAGLRTNDIYSPFPEEMNRRFISIIASYHFAPTSLAKQNLIKEGISEDAIFLTGNTVVDALRIIQERIQSTEIEVNEIIRDKVHEKLAERKKLVLLTMHRRESFNGGITNVLQAVKEFALQHSDVFFFYPFHPNPNVMDAIEKTEIAKTPNIFLTKPLLYKDLVYLLSKVHWVATDSGGIQEEAVSVGKPVMVLRTKTDRMESVLAGHATIVGTEKSNVLKHFKQMLHHTMPCTATTIYGDGYAADKIAEILDREEKISIQSKLNHTHRAHI